MFNSSTPLAVVTRGSELSFLCEEDADGRAQEKTLVRATAPHLSRVMQRGTAKHVGAEESEEDARVCIVAQAEREDVQEFSPTRSRWSRPHTQHRFLGRDAALSSDTEDGGHVHAQRKQRRRPRRRRSEEEGEEPPVIRGLWVQEVDWLGSAEGVATPAGGDGGLLCCTCAQVGHTSSSDGRGAADSESGGTHDSESDSSCCSSSTFDLMHVSSSSSSPADWDSTGCERSMPGPSASRCFDELRGRVTHTAKTLAAPFFSESAKQTFIDWTPARRVNEGLIFHPQLQPSGSCYREGEEYSVLQHIHSGAYGDVFGVRDTRTGFQCAAKRIPLSHFSNEEVNTWSALNSPRVVELFGAVREGLSVVLFMALKPACLAQLLKETDPLPEDLALHYLHQTLGALEHLHQRKVLHLDVKADNVLLSADCRDTFLCDFGLSETLDDSGRGTTAFRGAALPGTETHMAPEVARGERRCATADVWSSCCMLLHMLNGCHPWVRCYSHPLCLQIANEPAPLWEVPSSCNNFTAKVFRAGLRKDPDRRASARQLRRKTTKALRAVGGLRPWSIRTACEKLYGSKSPTEDSPCSLSTETTPGKPPDAVSAPVMYWVSPWRTTAVDQDWEDAGSHQDSEVETDSQPKPLRGDYSEEDIYLGEEEFLQEKWLQTERDYEGDWEEEEDEEEWDSTVSTEYIGALRHLFPLLQKGQEPNDSSWGSEPELQYLRDDVPVGTTLRTPSPEPRDDPPSCFSCSETSQTEEDSDHSSDDMSSGVFSSCNSHTGGHVEWLASADQPSSCCFQGVDIWIENVQGECLRIRERRQVKVGHVAVGISEQISGKTFTLETLDRKTVSFEREITEPCLWLRCVPAPDTCQRWSWRVRGGEPELRERSTAFS